MGLELCINWCGKERCNLDVVSFCVNQQLYEWRATPKLFVTKASLVSRVVVWKLPAVSILKLNVDATFNHGS